MFPLFNDPLPPARPEIAEASPYTSCGCVHGHGRHAHSHAHGRVSPSSSPKRTTSQRNRFFAEATQTHRRMDQCRAWASVVAGAARDAVHFNVVDAGSPYAGTQRSLPAFYYDPDAHEPAALHSHPPSRPHSACTSPTHTHTPTPIIRADHFVRAHPHAHAHAHAHGHEHADEREREHKPEGASLLTPGEWRRPGVKAEVDDHAQDEEQRPPSPHAPTLRHYRDSPAGEYQYARIEVLDEKPRRLDIEPHLEASALRKRRRHSPPPERAQRVKVEEDVPEASSSSAPAGASTTSHTVGVGTGDRRTEPVREPLVREPLVPSRAISERGLEAVAEPRRSHSRSTQTSPQPPRRQLSSSPPILVSSRSRTESRAPDQDSPQRVCDPLPSIGGLSCGREARRKS